MAFEYKQELIDGALSYTDYRQYIADTLSAPAINADAERLRPYTISGSAIMDSYDASAVVVPELTATLPAAPATTWLVITEGWCGDAAFNIPLMAALEKAAHGKIKLRLVLRDSNPQLMDAHLTDGGRSIPVLIVLSDQLQPIGLWGPRPQPLQLLMKQWKAEGLGLKELILNVNQWYDADSTQTLQQELTGLVKNYL